MTGGYGNSYAASVGNQAYQASLQDLNDVIPELYQLALDRHNMGKQDLYNQYGLLGSEYDREKASFDEGYNKLYDAHTLASSANEEAWRQKNFDEGVRQFEANLALQGASYDKSTGKVTVNKAPTLSASEYNDVMTNAETYAQMGKAALDNYLRGMMSRGLSVGEANNIRQQYFPTDEEEIPEVKKQGANYSGGGGGKDRIVHTLN